MGELVRELRFALRQSPLRRMALAALALATLAVAAGLADTSQQRTRINDLTSRVTAERQAEIAEQSDAGSAAYYTFHLTFDPPGPLAFAADGVRSVLPWTHRVRMLALEGQIYESDPGNPELSATGALDYAFVVATLLPLLLILTLHDLWASERRAGRLELLCATHTGGERVLVQRAVARAALVTAAIVIPLLVAALTARAPLAGTFGVAGVAVVHAAFWTVMSVIVARRVTAGPTTLTVLLGAWLVLSIVIPVAGKLVAERSVAVPSGGELLLLQREAVNDAWDKPKAATMTPFVAAHPQWAPHAAIEKPFEWKWYYAFQWGGDDAAKEMSAAIRSGVVARDRVMGRFALLSPPLLAERLITRTAGTGISDYLAYETCVRDFHAQLRTFYYPMLFGVQDYSSEQMKALPEYQPCATSG